MRITSPRTHLFLAGAICGASFLAGCKETTTQTEPDFALTLQPAALSVVRGNSGTSTVNITRTDLTDPVTLSVSGLPTGVTASFAPAAPTGATSTLTLAVGSTVAANAYTLSVSGTSGSTTHAASLSLTVTTTGGGSGSVSAVSSGEAHTCALKASGQLYCWGFNSFGQVGDGTTTDRPSPVLVTGGLTFTRVSAGDIHSCGVVTGGAAYCWGYGGSGAIGDGTITTPRLTPTAVSGGLSFNAISAAANPGRTCGLTTAGAGYCWGHNPHGEFGDNTILAKFSPTAVAGSHTYTALGTATSTTCGLSAGAAFCWGLNEQGQVGNGTTYGGTYNWTTPTPVSGGLTFASITVGYSHVCGLTAAGVAWCWGNNGAGQVGDGTTTSRSVPTMVSGGLTFASLSAATLHTCGITTGGAAYCWGNNTNGMLGDGTVTARLVPTAAGGGVSFASISTGKLHTCGVSISGLLYCWGTNVNNQLGDGTTSARLTPTQIVIP